MPIDLKAFGEKLRQLREQRGLTQPQLAKVLFVSKELISIWERAYSRNGRAWKPNRDNAVRLVEIFADHLTPSDAQRWLACLKYRLGQTELEQYFPTHFSFSESFHPPVSNLPILLKRLILPPEQRLFGIDQKQAEIERWLKPNEPPWLVAIGGAGGIGKTSLAAKVVHQHLASEDFHNVAWVSAKQEEFIPGWGVQVAAKPALHVDHLIDELLDQLGYTAFLTRTDGEKLAMLTAILKERPHLLIIDNLETLPDYHTLLPLLCKLVNPTKILLTIRYQLQQIADIAWLNLSELSYEHTADFIRYEADQRGIPDLATATPAQLHQIYEVVGGNPLALKLVVGQASVLSLPELLSNLREACGRQVDDLYTYIYWQAWHSLDETGHDVLASMPFAPGGSTLTHVSALNPTLSPEAIQQAIQHLAYLSLVEVRGELEERRYQIHRLTETFLLNEVLKWQQPR